MARSRLGCSLLGQVSSDPCFTRPWTPCLCPAHALLHCLLGLLSQMLQEQEGRGLLIPLLRSLGNIAAAGGAAAAEQLLGPDAAPALQALVVCAGVSPCFRPGQGRRPAGLSLWHHPSVRMPRKPCSSPRAARPSAAGLHAADCTSHLVPAHKEPSGHICCHWPFQYIAQQRALACLAGVVVNPPRSTPSLASRATITAFSGRPAGCSAALPACPAGAGLRRSRRRGRCR